MAEKKRILREIIKEFVDQALDSFRVESKAKVSEFEATGQSVLANLKSKEAEELAKAADTLKAIEDQKKKIDTLSTQATTAMNDIATKKVEVDKVAAVSATTTTELEKNKAILAALRKDYEESLKVLKESTGLKMEQIEKEIEVEKDKAKTFLKLATVATLAHTYSERKWGSTIGSWGWNIILFGTIAVAVAVALLSSQFGIQAISEALKPVDESAGILWFKLVEIFLVRLPVFGPLVWLIIIASGRSGFHSRLADDYAHKQSVMTVFEGYSKVLTGVKVTVYDSVKKVDIEKPAIEVLVRQTLEAINKEPERIHMVYVPQKNPVDETLDKAVKLVSEMQSKSGETPAVQFSKWSIAGLATAAALLIGTALKVFLGSH